MSEIMPKSEHSLQIIWCSSSERMAEKAEGSDYF